MFYWNDKLTNEALKLKGDGFTYKEISQKLSGDNGINITPYAVESRLRRYKKSQLNLSNDSKGGNGDFETYEESIIDKINFAEDQTPEDLMTAHGFDPEEFELVSVDNGIWQQGSQNGTRDLKKSRIKVKPREIVTKQSMEELIQKFTEPIYFEKKRFFTEEKRNLVIPLADIHFGITEYVDLESRLTEIVEIIRSNFYDTIVIENLGDYFHSDKINSSETVSGTILDDVNMVTAIEDGMKFMSVLIQEAIEHGEHVFVKSIGGNHSFDNEYLFMNWVQERFPQAEVEITNRYRTAYMLGNVLIMAQHGDLAKKNVELLLATEYPALWGVKKSAEIHRGHYHTEKITENHGVVVRQFGTPKREDPYEIKNGYTGNRKELAVLEYSEDKLKIEYHI